MKIKLTITLIALLVFPALADNQIISSSHSSPKLLLNLAVQPNELILIEMKTSKSGIGEISWSSGSNGFSPERSLSFYVQADGFHRYYLNLKAYAGKQPIKQVLLFPFAGPGSAEVKTLKAIKANLPQKIIAGWQEFWGPQGREPSGKDFLVIEPVSLDGRSIFFYLNWLIGLAIVISLLRRQPKFAIVLILALWLLLEASSTVNNWKHFKNDWKFWGKSLEEKRELQNVKDFYLFLKFADQTLPADATFTLITEPKYPFSVERAAYYLYPRKRSEQGAYLLLFDKLPNQQTARDYNLSATFREGAYIFKRK